MSVDLPVVLALVAIAFGLGIVVMYVGYRMYLDEQGLRALRADYSRLLAEREIWRSAERQPPPGP